MSRPLEIGDKIELGRYPHGADGKVLPLMWRVLRVENGKALLLTDKLIDCIPYHEAYTSVTWETCTLRQWLNGTFLRQAFDSGERAKIALTTCRNPDNPDYGTAGGNATQDRVFILSVAEAWQYFSSDEDRKGCAAPHMKKNARWWLRSPGFRCDSAACVLRHGGVSSHGSNVYDGNVAVRPALWIIIS